MKRELFAADIVPPCIPAVRDDRRPREKPGVLCLCRPVDRRGPTRLSTGQSHVPAAVHGNRAAAPRRLLPGRPALRFSHGPWALPSRPGDVLGITIAGLEVAAGRGRAGSSANLSGEMPKARSICRRLERSRRARLWMSLEAIIQARTRRNTSRKRRSRPQVANYHLTNVIVVGDTSSLQHQRLSDRLNCAGTARASSRPCSRPRGASEFGGRVTTFRRRLPIRSPYTS